MFDNIKNVVLCAVIVLLASCGKQHKAEGVVKDFLNKSLVAQDYTVSLSKIDSTKRVSKAAIAFMRMEARKNKSFKQPIKYGDDNYASYVFTRATIAQGRDTLVHTFYLDSEVVQVVAFKEN